MKSENSHLFFHDLNSFGGNPALINAANDELTSYEQLACAINQRMNCLQSEKRQLVFLECTNSLQFICDYLSCLELGYVVCLLGDLQSDFASSLANRYRANIFIDRFGGIVELHNDAVELNPNLAILLATSGSTGSPKLVRLSYANIQSNARAISEYLNLTADDRALCYLKPNYSFGLSIIHSHLLVGASMVQSNASFTELINSEVVRKTNVTSFSGLPHNFKRIAGGTDMFSDCPRLRYATQAGGKLDPKIIALLAKGFSELGVEFYTMYGQTEASPRMSYLPPEYAASHPDSIGIAIPNGILSIVDDDGRNVEKVGTTGELVYEGPNVMMGYASDSDDLIRGSENKKLYTGDIAYRDCEGFFYIVGRTSRYVKPLGVRTNLDDIESYLGQNGFSAAVVGDDFSIIVAIENEIDSTCTELDVQSLSLKFGVPTEYFSIVKCDSLPRLDNGKLNYREISNLRSLNNNLVKPGFWNRVQEILGLTATLPDSVLEAFVSVTADDSITSEMSFLESGCDSLAHVSLSIQLDTMFQGDLPLEWSMMKIRELEEVLMKKRNRTY